MSVRKIRNSWWVDFRFDKQRYRRRAPTNSKEGAKDYESLIRQKLAKGENLFEEKTEAKEPFSKFAWNWFEVWVKNNNKHSEIMSKEINLRVHLLPFFGKVPLEKIDSQMVERYKREKLKTTLNSKTINNQLSTLRKCLNVAVEWQILDNIPRIKLLKTTPSKFYYLEELECKRLLDNTKGNLHDMILLGLNTGLRFGEIIALTWDDVDLNRNILSVNKSISKGILGSTKSNRNRFVPISNQLHEMLQHRARKGELIFSENNTYIKQRKYIYHIYRACRVSHVKKIGWHVLRHTFASQLAQKGISLKAIQELLGHSDIQTTMRYAHLSPKELRSAIDVLNFGQHLGNTPDFDLNIPLSKNAGEYVLTPILKQKQSFRTASD